MSDRVLVMDEGESSRTLRRRREQLRHGHAMFMAMPTAMRVGRPCQTAQNVPYRPGQADWLADFAAKHPLIAEPSEPFRLGETAISLEDVWFQI